MFLNKIKRKIKTKILFLNLIQRTKKKKNVKNFMQNTQVMTNECNAETAAKEVLNNAEITTVCLGNLKKK